MINISKECVVVTKSYPPGCAGWFQKPRAAPAFHSHLGVTLLSLPGLAGRGGGGRP